MYQHMLRKYPPRSPTVAEMKLERIEQARERVRQMDAERKARLEKQSQVYYVRIGDHVKIGFTVCIQERMASLRVDVEAVMATEPGGRELEAERHRQFAAERQGKRENFNPSPRLLAHIQQVLADNGPPKITTYKTAAPPAA